MASKYGIALIFIIGILLLFACCKDDPVMDERIDPQIEYNPVDYVIEAPESFPEMIIPEDNLLTEEGVELGRRLFHDKILSVDNSIACASCHLKEDVFSDPNQFSEGVNGELGKRQAMSIVNSGYFNEGLFWDGRSPNLEDQAIHPVQDPLEMANTWNQVVNTLREHDDYPERFRKAFGIEFKSEITQELVIKAIAQYERALVSSADSKFDKYQRGETELSGLEFDGFAMYNDLAIFGLPDAECAHCHNGSFLTTDQYMNNGLDPADDNFIFPDQGRGAVTGILSENGKFRVPTLRNIALTGPYMHDGRFNTLEEVIDHYNSGGHYAPNRDALIGELGLNAYQKSALVAFLHTFTDTSFLTQEIFSDPFE